MKTKVFLHKPSNPLDKQINKFIKEKSLKKENVEIQISSNKWEHMALLIYTKAV